VSRPRLSPSTSEFVDELDSLLAKYNIGEVENVSLEPLKGRGNGSNNFTKDSVIKFALKEKTEELRNLDDVLEEMSRNE